MNKEKNKIAFFGTSLFSIYVLEELIKGEITPDLIITTPNTPQGRNLKILPPPIKIWADEKNIKTFQPNNLKTTINELGDYDLFVVASYGKMIPLSILELPKYGTLNVHPSLLPKYRGASPIQTSILNGDNKTGTTIMLMDKELDHGPIIDVQETELDSWKPTYLELEEKLAKIGGKLLTKLIPPWIDKKIMTHVQDHDEASYTNKLEKPSGFIDPLIFISPNVNPAENILAERKIRALNPDPGVFTYFQSKNKKIRAKITRAHIDLNGQLKIDTLIPEGKREMRWEEFARGNQIELKI